MNKLSKCMIKSLPIGIAAFMYTHAADRPEDRYPELSGMKKICSICYEHETQFLDDMNKYCADNTSKQTAQQLEYMAKQAKNEMDIFEYAFPAALKAGLSGKEAKRLLQEVFYAAGDNADEALDKVIPELLKTASEKKLSPKKAIQFMIDATTKIEYLIDKYEDDSGYIANINSQQIINPAFKAGFSADETTRLVEGLVSEPSGASLIEYFVCPTLEAVPQAHFSYENIEQLLGTIIQRTKEYKNWYWNDVGNSFSQALKATTEAKLNPEQIVQLVTDIVNTTGEDGPYMLGYGVPATLKAGLSLEQTLRLLECMAKEQGYKTEIGIKSEKGVTSKDEIEYAFNKALPAAFDAANSFGLSNTQTEAVFKNVIKEAGVQNYTAEGAGKNVNDALENIIPAVLKAASERNISPDDATQFLLEVTKRIGGAYYTENRKIIYSSLKAGFTFEETAKIMRDIHSGAENNIIFVPLLESAAQTHTTYQNFRAIVSSHNTEHTKIQ